MHQMDRLGAFLREKTPRRIIALGTFVGLIVLFRPLLLLLVFFVTFERLLGSVADLLEKRARWSHERSVLAVVGLFLAVLAVAVGLGARSGLRWIAHVRQVLPDRIAAFREHPLYEKLHEHLQDSESLMEKGQRYAEHATHYLAAVGHALLYALIGLIIAVVYLLERHEIERFRASVDPRSFIGVSMRWLGYTADAVVVTLQLQVIVAGCNAVMTLPVLVFLGIGHIPTLALFIFVSGLIPVVGNFVAGVVLSLLAYSAKGWLGVGVFVGLTFVLHKIESYYLNPRLTSRHVHLPGFVLILSLIAWEHLLGIVGLFASFPILYVAGKIRREWIMENEQDALAPAADLAGRGPSARAR